MTVDLRGATYSASRIIKGRTKQFGWLQAPATNYRTCLTIQFTFPVTMRPKVLGFVPRLDNSLFLEALPFMAFLLWTSMSLPIPSERSRPKNLQPFRSDLGSAAVNEQFGTRDETGVIRRQKQRHLSNFLGFPHASHRDGGHNPRDHVCRLPTCQRRIDRTRTNNV